MAALACISDVRRLFYIGESKFARNHCKEGIKVDDAGIIIVYFNINGKRIPVIIDDFLPVINGRLVFATSSSGCLWPSFVEKAWAKLNGRYKRIEETTLHTAFTHLSGAATSIKLKEFFSSFFNVKKQHLSFLCVNKNNKSSMFN